MVSRRRKEEEEVVVVSFRLLSAIFFRGRGAALATQKLSKEPILLIFRFNDTAKERRSARAAEKRCRESIAAGTLRAPTSKKKKN